MARRRGSGSYTNRGDGVPAQKYTGLDYGENKAVNNQMDAAPTRPQQGGGPPGGGRPQPGPARGPDGVFGPTDRPDEPLTAGIDDGPGSGRVDSPLLQDDPYLMARALYQVAPSPQLERLMARLARG